MRNHSLLLVTAISLLGCHASPDEPRVQCQSRAPNVRYDVPEMGDWKAELLASIEAVPDTQWLEISFLLTRMPTTADSTEIIAYGGHPNWYWVESGRSPLPVRMRAADIRRFIAEAKLDYVWDSRLPYYACPM